MCDKLKLSSLGKTWIFDLDGTLVKHNGYKIDGEDTLLEGVAEFFDQLTEIDMVVIITARPSQYKEQTLEFLAQHQIHYDHIIFDAPHGERILFNDLKPSGLKTAYSINQIRDCFNALKLEVDESL